MELPQFVIWAKGIIENFGYLGVFFINFIGCATILFPLPAAPLVFIFGAVLNPLFVAIFAALGATLGELTGYGIGFGGKKILEKKYPDSDTVLHYKNPFQLLVATILSAQGTDARVNIVTKTLFKKS